MWPLNNSKFTKFSDFIQIVVCVRKHLLHKGIKSSTNVIFVIFLHHIFLKMIVAVTLKFVNRPSKKSLLVTNFLNLFFAIICHKESCLFDKISPIFENTYHEN